MIQYSTLRYDHAYCITIGPISSGCYFVCVLGKLNVLAGIDTVQTRKQLLWQLTRRCWALHIYKRRILTYGRVIICILCTYY